MKNKIAFWSICSIVLIVFILGLFYDLSFARIIYDKNNGFAKFMAAIGETPAYGGLAFIGGGFVVQALRKTDIKWKIVLFLFAFACLATGILLSTRAIKSHNSFDIEDKWYIALPIALLLDGGCFIGGFFLTKNSKNPEILRVLIFMLLTIITILLTVTVLKRVWGRPRYRWLSNNNKLDYYQNWWNIGFNKEEFIKLGVDSDEFKSCPSGHTSSAACALLLAYLPQFNDKLKGKEYLFLLCGALWAGIVGFTRHILGAHFLTDTSFAYLIAIISLMLYHYLFFVFHKKEKKSLIQNN